MLTKLTGFVELVFTSGSRLTSVLWKGTFDLD